MTSRLQALAFVAVVASVHASGQRATPPTTSGVPPPTPPQTISPRPLPAPGPNPFQGGARLGTITGQVVDAIDGRPVAKVAVRLSGRGVFQTRLTDDKGRVAFTDIPAGDFTINATKAGFFDGSYGKRRASGVGMPLTLLPGQPISDVRIELFKPAVISGYVFDESNEPVIGAPVVALRRQFTGGQWRFTAVGTQVTDDEGSYRIFALMPGEYIVSVPLVQVTAPMAAFEAIADTGSVTSGFSSFFFRFFYSPVAAEGPGGGERMQTRLLYDRDDRNVMMPTPALPPPPEGRREYAYPTKYYPTADAITTALPVAVGPGQDHRGVNIELRPVRAARIEGMVIGPHGAVPNQQLRLLPVDGGDFGPGTETAATVTAPDGTFTFLHIPSGRYTIEALGVNATPASSGAPAPILVDLGNDQPALWGRALVGIEDTDVSAVIVLMEPTLTVTGSSIFEGSAVRPVRDQIAPIEVSLVFASGAPAPRLEARLDSSGRFAVRGVTPGEYFVRVDSAPAGWFVKSVTVAGRDVSDAPLVISSSADPLVTITFTDRPTEVVGTVRDARNLPVAGATVIAMPATAVTGGLHPIRTREVRSASSGVFTLSGLPAGEYYVVAIDDATSEGWQDPARLAVLQSQATRMTLHDAEKRGLELRLSGRR